MRGAAVLLAALALAAPSLAAGADPSAALRIQELEGRLADAEQRAAHESAERAKVSAALEQALAKATALADEAERQRRRAEDLESRISAASDREEALRAELDLCGRSRQSAEEQKNRLRSQLDASAARQQAELSEGEGKLEECRGRAAVLEANNLLLAAEKQGLEREARERADEITCNYDALVLSARRELSACQKSLTEAEAGRALLTECQERQRADETERAQRAEAAAQLLSQVGEALREDVEKGRISLSEGGGGVWVRMRLDALFGPKPNDLRPAGRELLKRVGAALGSVGNLAVVVAGIPAAPPESAKKPSNPWDAAGSPGARVAQLLQSDGGFEPARVTVVSRSPSAYPRAEQGAELMIGIVPPATLGTVPPWPLPSARE